MAKNEKARININLSSRKDETVGKVFYRWAINSGRAIIVIIELIALAALGYRFVIDRQIVDLHDSIKNEASALKTQEGSEKVYRSVQDRLKHIKQTQEATALKFGIMNEILKTVSSGTLFSTNLSITDKSATVTGTTFSILTLTNFVETLKKIPAVSEISITEVNTTDEGVKFEILIQINPTGKEV